MKLGPTVKALYRLASFLPAIRRRDEAIGELTRQLAEKSQQAELLTAQLAEKSKQAELLATRAIDPAQYRAEFNKSDERTAYFSGNGLHISFKPEGQYPFTRVRIERADGAVFDELLYYSHLALGRLLAEYEFSSALEIGSANGTAARAMTFAGKKVFTVDILNTFDVAFTGDYLDLRLDAPVDAIWCSHTLEHQRHLGRFLEKMFDDLREGGTLAVTVPAALAPLIIGHCNIFTPGHMLYNLILAGFDCSEARVKVYDWQYSVLLTKKSNGITRIGFASTHYDTGDELGRVEQLLDFFPPYFRERFKAGHVWGEVGSINW